PGPPQASDLLLDGLTAPATEGYRAGLPALRDALRILTAGPENLPGPEAVSILWLACRVAITLWDDESFVRLSARHVAAARGTGTVQELPAAFGMAATTCLLTGNLGAAGSYVEQLDAALAVTGSVPAPHGRLALAGWEGRADPHPVRGAGDRAAGLGVSAYTTALLCNGLGRYADAADAASAVRERTDQLGYTLWALPELAEAAARTGRLDLAGHAGTLLEQTTRPSGTEWALGMYARCRALLCEGEQAEELYAQAVTRLGRTRL